MSRPMPSNETQRQRAFRSLAVARQQSLTQDLNAEAAYEPAQQAVHGSRCPLEEQFAIQLQNIVDSDRERHQQMANTGEFPASGIDGIAPAPSTEQNRNRTPSAGRRRH